MLAFSLSRGASKIMIYYSHVVWTIEISAGTLKQVTPSVSSR